MNILDLFLFSGATHGVVLALLLITSRKGNNTANIILSFALFSLSIELFTSVKMIFPENGEINLFNPINLLIAPLFYFYTLLITREESSELTPFLYPILPIYLIPTLIYFKDYLIYFTLNTQNSFPYFGNLSVESYSSIFQLSSTLVAVSLINSLLYLMLSIREIEKFRKKSSLSVKNRNYLIVITTMFVWVSLSIGYFIYVLKVDEITAVKSYYPTFQLIISILLFSLSYITLRKPITLFKPTSIKSDSFQEEDILIEEEQQSSKVSSSELSDIKYDIYIEQILSYMKNNKPYIDCDLTLESFSKNVDLHYKLISKLLNNRLNQTFNDFINSYRIEEVKKRLADPENSKQTIISIAFECGFNSKSSFNSFFKKSEEITPTEFRKRALEKAQLVQN